MVMIHDLKAAQADNAIYQRLGAIFEKAAKPQVEAALKASLSEGADAEGFKGDMVREASYKLMCAWLYNVSLQQTREGKITDRSVLPGKSTPAWRNLMASVYPYGMDKEQTKTTLRAALTELCAQEGDKIELPLKLELDKKTVEKALVRK